MITDIITILLLIYIAFQDYLNRKERKKLIEAFLAKNLTEFKEVDKSNIADIPPVVELEDIPITEATEEEFDQAIRKDLGRETIMEKAKDNLKKIIGHK